MFDYETIKKALDVEIEYSYIDIRGKKMCFSKFILNELYKVYKKNEDGKTKIQIEAFEYYPQASLSDRRKTVKNFIKYLKEFKSEKVINDENNFKNIKNTDIKFLKGVGPKIAYYYYKLGINTINDLITFYPKKYIDYTLFKTISELVEGEFCTIKATVLSFSMFTSKKNLTIVKVTLKDATGTIVLNYFFRQNNKYLTNKYRDEFKKGTAGRFAPGLPAKGDGQLLFMLNGLAKLKDDGQMAIIQNGSSLFNGDAGSGPSEIRRYLIENDWLDAIVQLPYNAFYNTGIATYIWIVMKNKPVTHQGKVQLIDASACCAARRKNIGSKNVDITKACRDLVIEAYGAYVDGTYNGVDENDNAIIVKSKVMDAVDLGYNKIVVETPQLDEDGNVVMKKKKPVADTSKRDTENVPLAEDIDAYFEREVIPYNPQAWIDKAKTKVGYEIPFTRTFYEYKQIEPSDMIAARIEEHEKSLMAKLHDLFGGE